MQLKSIFLSLGLGLFFVACGPAETPPMATAEPAPAPAPTPTPPPAPAPTEAAPAANAVSGPVYTWVSTLNVRAEPTTSAKIVATVTPGQPLRPTGMRSDNAAAISLRGYTFNDIWHEVTTPDGKKGWVFGGTIQPPDHGTKNFLQRLTDGQKCPAVGGPDDPMDGCSCGFSTDDERKEYVLAASFAGNACITLDGNTYQLDGWYDGYSYLADSQFPWITLKDKESTLFGTAHDFDYDETVQRLTEALLSYDKIPTEVSIKNEMTAGTFIREVRDMATDAIAAAKKRRAAGERNGDVRMEYSNDRYRVILTGNEYNNPMSDTGTNYEALLQILDANGKVLERVPVRGHCGC